MDGQRKDVIELEYEAYTALALKLLQEIAQQHLEKHSLCRIAIVHRIGRVGISETSLVVVVSGTHRSEPIQAVKEMVDRIKAIVPIWKKERYRDGSVWKGNVECTWGQDCSCERTSVRQK